MSHPRIIIVDKQDKVIGYKPREDVKLTDIYRVTGLWITNSRGELLLARRAFGKRHDPGKWGPSAAGTVEEGETYDSNAAKEAEEELGLTDIKLVRRSKLRFSGRHNYFCRWYTAVVDKPAEAFVIQSEEVIQVRWITREELNRELKDNPDQYLYMELALKELDK
jgi:isopentenyl-diphosphate Delta-isomerase